MLKPRTDSWRVSGGEPPVWMRRVNLGLLGLSVLLVLVCAINFWPGTINTQVWERVPLAASRTLRIGFSSLDLLLLIFFAACVAYTIVAERGAPQRFSALILVGALLDLAAGLLTRRGALTLGEDLVFTQLPAGLFRPALMLALAGSLCAVLGLADLVRRRLGRGAVVGVCAAFLPLHWSAWMYHQVVAPDSPQLEACLERTELALVPGSYPVRKQVAGLLTDCVELVTRGAEETVVVHGSLLSNSEYPRCLEDYATAIPLKEGQWGGRAYRYRRAHLTLRVARQVSTGAVLDVIEQARAVGIERFEFYALQTEPSIEGVLVVYAEAEFFGSNEETPILRLFRPHPEAEDPSPIFRFRGLSSANLEELLPRPPGLLPPPSDVIFTRERIILRVDPSLDWQTTASALGALNCRLRVVFLERLDE